LSCPINIGSTLVVRTRCGPITITGGHTTECHVSAKICASAKSSKKAKLLASEIKVKLESSNENLFIIIEEPSYVKDREAGVELKILVPQKTNLKCATSLGSIVCKNIASKTLYLESALGDISVSYSDSASHEITSEIFTSLGKIDFLAPPQFSGRVDLTTSFGKIETDLPIKLEDRTTRGEIKGSIGQGKGVVRLASSLGSIKIN
jgi:DUF4097 and DUF4098 domain-containing protein YvlB